MDVNVDCGRCVKRNEEMVGLVILYDTTALLDEMSNWQGI